MSVSPLQLRERIPPARPAGAGDAPAPQSDRRVAQRIHAPFQAEISLIVNNRVDRIIPVIVQDLSTTGLRLQHVDRLEQGAKYLLEIPRPGQPPIGAIFTVVRSDETEGGGSFNVQLAPEDVLDMTTRAAIRKYVAPERASNVVIAAVLSSLIAAAVTSYFLFF
jgi:PilZ domain-containing protein